MSKVFGQPLLDDMARSRSLPMPLVKQAAREILEVIREGLIRDKVVKVSNFGTFRLKPVAARRGINPQTGESITIPARHRVIFTPCKALRELIQPVHRPPVPIEPEQPHPEEADDKTAHAAALMASAYATPSQSEEIVVEKVPQNDDFPSPAPQTDTSPTSTLPQDFPPSPEEKEQPQEQPQAPTVAERVIDIEITPLAEQETEKDPSSVESSLAKQPEAAKNPALSPAETGQNASSASPPGAESNSQTHNEMPPVSTHAERQPADEASNNRKYLILSAAVIVAVALLGVAVLTDKETTSPEMVVNNSDEGSPAAAEQPEVEINQQSAATAFSASAGESETAQTVSAPQLTTTEGTVDESTNNIKAAESSTTQSSEDFFSTQTHTVANGESLWRLAGHHYHDPLLWPHIYQANTDIIDNPDYLLVGRSITIPGLQGNPGALTRTDRRNIAEGYYLAYLYYKKVGRKDALFALLEAKRYDKAVVEEHREQFNLTRVEELKLAQQAPMPF